MQHIPLYSVPFYRTHVQEHAEIEHSIPLKKIKKLAIHPSPWRCNVLVSQDSININEHNLQNQWYHDFYDICGNYFKEFVKITFNLQSAHISFLGSWINLYKRNSFQEWHNHMGTKSMFSYCYFYKIPNDQNCGKFLFKSKLMDLEAAYPAHLMTQTVVQTNASQNEIFIFPSWQDHMVTQHNCDEERITFSGNFYVS